MYRTDQTEQMKYTLYDILVTFAFCFRVRGFVLVGLSLAFLASRHARACGADQIAGQAAAYAACPALFHHLASRELHAS